MQFVETIEKCQGYKVACLEEIAYSQRWLSIDQVALRADLMVKNHYGDYLRCLVYLKKIISANDLIVILSSV